MALELGDVVRLRMVATVTAVTASAVTVTTFGGTPITFPKAVNDDAGFAYEVVPAPEPAYVGGELYRDAAGHVFQRVDTDQPGDRWRVVVHPSRPVGQYVGELFPARPLTKLVPDPG